MYSITISSKLGKNVQLSSLFFFFEVVQVRIVNIAVSLSIYNLPQSRCMYIGTQYWVDLQHLAADP